eukprot:gene23712-54063_t
MEALVHDAAAAGHVRPAAAPEQPAAAVPARSARERMAAIFAAYAPDKAANVDKLLTKYAGQEEQVIRKLVERLHAQQLDDGRIIHGPDIGDRELRFLRQFGGDPTQPRRRPPDPPPYSNWRGLCSRRALSALRAAPPGSRLHR